MACNELSLNEEGAIKMITVDCVLRQTNVPGSWTPVLEKALVMTPKWRLSDGRGRTVPCQMKVTSAKV